MLKWRGPVISVIPFWQSSSWKCIICSWPIKKFKLIEWKFCSLWVILTQSCNINFLEVVLISLSIVSTHSDGKIWNIVKHTSNWLWRKTQSVSVWFVAAQCDIVFFSVYVHRFATVEPFWIIARRIVFFDFADGLSYVIERSVVIWNEPVLHSLVLLRLWWNMQLYWALYELYDVQGIRSDV
jgi:hypothetical protein